MRVAAVTAILVGCASTTASITPGAGTPGPTASATRPSATTVAATDTSDDPRAGRTFPPSQTPIEPGTYRWDGFERPITVDLGSGWALGHDNPSFFDLFRGSDFPAITFARFSDVYVDGTVRMDADDAAAVASTLAGRTDLTVAHPSVVEIGGLTGRQFDLTTTEPRTPLFFGPAGDFKLDPGFVTRYRVLDFPGGGVLVVGIHARTGAFDDAVALGDPVVASLAVEP